MNSDKPSHISEEEWALRVQLAHCYHLVDFFGWTETIFNHISARLPGREHAYLVNPFGLNYTEVTPANLLKVDLEGNKVEPSPYDANPAGFALHSAIHGAREDIHCVIHTHTNPVSAVAQKKAGFSHDNFYGAQLYGRVGYHAFEGITLFAEEKARMLASLGDKHILVLRNHGVAVGEMEELLKTNDPVLLSFVEALLAEAGIDHFVADRNMSIMEGSIGVLPRRVLVPRADLETARALLRDAEIDIP